jgi:hypothetical protein
VTTREQTFHQWRPAGRLVPRAMDQAEGGHRPCISAGQRQMDHDRLEALPALGKANRCCQFPGAVDPALLGGTAPCAPKRERD